MSSSVRLASKSSQQELNENEFGTSLNQNHFPPPRTPLNSIPDPSQYQKDIQECEVSKPNRSSPSDKKTLETSGGGGSTTHVTPRVLARNNNNHGKFHSELSSAHTTPARSGGGGGSRVSLGGRGGVNSSSFSKVSRGLSVVNPEISAQVPQFEIVEDPLFWKDHNVQVLIRIRPLSTLERASQGYTQCLRQESAQTLAWLGHPETRFTFDHIACEAISQEKLFKVAGLPMVENCLSGYNSCMFAYGQTGSGKTYTMMGEINEVEGKLSEDCGVTPRIFEYLFSRIRTEEESRKDERLKFSCKCSFLEIYNEQITDLLEPSSTNLQLREDLKKGVYVENLTEYNVTTVNDVVKLLLQGAANRKMAATHMNSESSRSHSVFTCIIESCWEKDAMAHFRFARLNLVDLAGSERQKSSGAEGDRLKEAANINKSLSTLGLVIMSLVDLAHGKHRHVPYRDSRLTFLLQDSLGGNSKTTIIANVSPSICSANETLSTLKFAQRAKLIQNNAKVNEDASGDVTALQRQIQQLKDQLSSLKKHHSLSRSPSRVGDNFKKHSFSEEGMMDDKVETVPDMKMKRMEAMLVGALRREKMAEAACQKLEAEIEHMNRLGCQRDDDIQRTKMMLKLREEKIKHLELLVKGSVSAENYLMEENKALKEETKLLLARVDRNPELTRFALENIRLLEQLQMFQNFYEQGERETLLAEVAELRDQLLDIIEGKDGFSSRYENQDNDFEQELNDHRNMNSKLMREVDVLRKELKKYLNHEAASSSVADTFSKDREEFGQTDKYSLVETTSNGSDSGDGDEVAYYNQAESVAPENKNDQNMSSASIVHHSDAKKELMEARFLIEALECEQVRLHRELELMEEQNQKSMEILSNKNNAESQSVVELESYSVELDDLKKQNKGQVKEGSEGIDKMSLQAKLDKLTNDLEVARLTNCQYQEDQASQLSRQHEVGLICEQVEMETAKTILQLQEEVGALQLELNERLCCMSEENTSLRNTVAAKEEEIKMLRMEWEKVTLELTNFLVDGSRSLKDASGQIESIACSFPQVNVGIIENVERAARVCIEKEKTILLLQKSLEDAQKMVMEMEEKLTSLKGATIALNEFQQPDDDESKHEVMQLSLLLNEKISTVKVLESKLKSKEDQIWEAEKRAEAAFLAVKCLSDKMIDTDRDVPISEQAAQMRNFNINEMKADANALAGEDIKAQVELARLGVLESEHAINAYYEDTEVHIEALQTDILDASSAYKRMVQDLIKEVHEMSSFIEGKSFKEHDSLKFENRSHILQQIKDELAETNGRLRIIEDCINKELGGHVPATKDDNVIDADGWSADCSTSSSDYSTESVSSGSNLEESSYTYCSKLRGGYPEDSVMLKKLSKESVHGGAMTFRLGKELEVAFDAFSKLYFRLTILLNGKDFEGHTLTEGMKQGVPSFGSMMEIDDAGCPTQAVAGKKMNHASGFFSKFEEARETMREADFMLNELLKANEKAKQLNGTWRQAGEQLMSERASLIEEVEQLKSSVLLKEEENELLLDNIHRSMLEILNSVSLLEGCFVQIQKEVEDRFKELYSDAISVKKEMPNFIYNSRLSLEDFLSEIMENGFALTVMHMCYIEKFTQTPNYGFEFGFPRLRQQESHSVTDMEGGEMCLSQSDLLYANLSLKKELERKEILLQGLLFDFSLLQESASNSKDIKDETEKLFVALNQVRHDLEMKTSQLDDLLLQHKKLEISLSDTENSLLISKETIDTLSDQNAELRVLLKDLYFKKSEAEEQLEEQKEVVKGLEKEILHRASVDKKFICKEVECIKEDLRKVCSERDKLQEEIFSLNDKLEMAYAFAEENEAIAVEARQESESSKIYAEQKEEEVKILEHSVEELESTINVLEIKVNEMDEEVERHRLIRDSLEQELQALRQRLSAVGNFHDIIDPENTNAEHTEDQMSRQLHNKVLQLHEAHKRIRLLERESEEQDKEIKRCKEYISEVVLHSEAQASQYQQKYKTLEKMMHEIKADLSNQASTSAAVDKNEKTSTRTRGSSSPFRCISSLVQQMNLEKDHELSIARHRIEELEALAASRQKEVCMLNTRLAAAESMTHDVIRDLLGVKLDMTNYADLIDQHQVQNLVVAAHQHTEDLHAKEQAIHNLKKQIDDLIEERESCISQLKIKEADVLAAQMTVEQLQERDQLLSAQNEMLKTDKTNLKRRIIELDDMVKTLLGTHQEQVQQTSRIKGNGFQRPGETDLNRRLSQSEKLLSRVNGELARYQKSNSSRPHDKTNVHGFETNYRR